LWDLNGNLLLAVIQLLCGCSKLWTRELSEHCQLFHVQSNTTVFLLTKGVRMVSCDQALFTRAPGNCILSVLLLMFFCFLTFILWLRLQARSGLLQTSDIPESIDVLFFPVTWEFQSTRWFFRALVNCALTRMSCLSSTTGVCLMQALHKTCGDLQSNVVWFWRQ